MRFTYDADLNSLSIYLRDSPPVIMHQWSERILVEIDEDGTLCRVQVDAPDQHWGDIAAFLHSYNKVSIDEAYIITLLSERTSLFRFGELG